MRLAVIYGHLWKSLYQTEEFLNFAKQEWQGSLKSFEDVTLDKAILHCKQHESYPPSLPMFVDICKSKTKNETYFTNNTRDAKPSSPEVARMHLNQMREMLNVSSPSRK